MRCGMEDDQQARTRDARRQLQQRHSQSKQEMQAQLDTLVGRDINQKVKSVEALSDAELDVLSTFLNR